ncbi:MAG: ABC transporter [Spirochaetes bacterium]|nr:ABC transporter [Spirochaetota bacterium]
MNEMVINWQKVLIIAKKELRFFFFSPIAYIFVCIFLALMGVVFFFFPFYNFFMINQVEMRIFFEILPPVLSIIIPLVTMALFSEEFSVGSYEILNTLAVTTFDITLGKFIAATAFIASALIPTLIYPVSLMLLGDLSIMPVIGGYIGSVFLIGALTSIGILTSAITKNQIIAFITAFAACLTISFLIQLAMPVIPGIVSPLFDYLSAFSHFSNIARGILDWRDILYFLSIIVIALYSTKLVLDNRK